MAVTITIKDATTGRGADEWTLDFLDERITVRELIRSRVFQEVKDYNARMPKLFRGLVQPTDAEIDLNGYKLNKPRRIDWQEQFETALKAYNDNSFILLVDERQVDGLEEELRLTPDTKVTFLKLMPLVGG